MIHVWHSSVFFLKKEMTLFFETRNDSFSSGVRIQIQACEEIFPSEALAADSDSDS